MSRAPLVRVVAQVRFPGILKIDNKESVALFQEDIRQDYPLFEQATNQQIQLEVSPAGPSIRQIPANLWRFRDSTANWCVTLITDALSLEVVTYSSRDDFMSRWSKILAAFERTFNPRIALRIGVRYVDRVVGQELDRIDELVIPDILAFARPPFREHVHGAVSEANVTIEEGEMLLRWGIMPPNGTIDPNTLPPIPQLSWILDIDVSSAQQRQFLNAELSNSFEALAKRAYSVFRYMTTQKFLEAYGATI